LFDESLQLRIRKEFPPVHIAEVGRIIDSHLFSVQVVRSCLGRLIFGVYAATAQQSGCGCQYDYFLHTLFIFIV